MIFKTKLLVFLLAVGLSACGGSGSSDLFGGNSTDTTNEAANALGHDPEDGTIWDLFGNNEDANTNVAVNRYLWIATLDVLNFLPIQVADPFTGIISTGYGTPPGGGRAYRANIFIQDPALEARSLRVSVVSRSGPVGADTTRAVEDAILARARQLRIQSGNL